MRPHLAAKKNFDQIRMLFNDGDFVIETKYDGERIQLHFDENDIKVYSRNCHDVTNIYGAFFSSFIRQSIGACAGILDGELAVVDKSTLKPVEFGKNKNIAVATTISLSTLGSSKENSNGGDLRYQLCCNLIYSNSRLCLRYIVRQRLKGGSLRFRNCKDSIIRSEESA